MADLKSIVVEFYEKKLEKNGKPRQNQEWTVFCAIILEDPNGSKNVVAAGSGSKCLGSSEISMNGDLLHDSHAEVICKRAFYRYLLDQIRSIDEGSILEQHPQTKLFSLKPEFKFHFFSSHPPCGDGSIAIKHEPDEPDPKRSKLDIHRTGAKCLKGDTEDDFGVGLDYHTALGAIRTKPGRGDPTSSLSCSDKLVKWNFLGWQGSILAAILKCPIHMSSLTFCADLCFEPAIRRALQTRFSKELPPAALDIQLVDSVFPCKKKEGLVPNPCSIIACLLKREVQTEVSVDGRKQGCIKKYLNTPRARNKICRLSYSQEFLEVIKDLQKPPQEIHEVLERKEITYQELKAISKWLSRLKAEFMTKLHNWPRRNCAKNEFKILFGKSASII